MSVSFEHELLVDMLRESDRLLRDLLREICGVDIGAVRIDKSSENWADVDPPRFSADTVLVTRRKGSRNIEGFIAEVQRSWKSEKRRKWPHYATSLALRLGCPVSVIVLATTRAVARKAREPIPIGRNGSFTPIVIGPDDIPKITDPQAARAMPELAVLSVATHRRAGLAERTAIAHAALIGTDQADLDERRRALYLDLILKWIGARVLQKVERKMDLENYKYQSKPMKQAFAEGRSEGLAEGRSEGLAEGRSEGLAEGRSEGLAEGKREALLAIIDARDLHLSEQQRERIATCEDPADLQEWLVKAATATTPDDIFG